MAHAILGSHAAALCRRSRQMLRVGRLDLADRRVSGSALAVPFRATRGLSTSPAPSFTTSPHPQASPALPAGSTHPPAASNCYTPPMARARTPHRHPPTTPEVMTISDLAVYLQMSQSSLYKLVQRGSVPGHKVGRHWRFHKVSIDKWLQESSIKPSHPPKK